MEAFDRKQGAPTGLVLQGRQSTSSGTPMSSRLAMIAGAATATVSTAGFGNVTPIKRDVWDQTRL